MLPAEFTRDADRVRRFEKEARAASALNHPNLITIHEIGQVASAHHIVTEFVEGETLRRQITQGALTIDTALEVSGANCERTGCGTRGWDRTPRHQAGERHGPARRPGQGAGLWPGQVEPSRTFRRLIPNPQHWRRSARNRAVVMGTVSYMSPEQVRGQKVDARSDIFSLGVVLYEMIAGRRPFEGGTKSDVIVALLTAEPLPLRQHCTEAPVELERIVGKCLAKDREDRYQSAKELIADLKKLRHGGRAEEGDASHRLDAARPKFVRGVGLPLQCLRRR